jgi:ABC-type lipoprotein export system ATPase subunit
MQYSRFLRLVDVCKKVGKSNKTSILNNISLEFPNHGMFFLSGKNGSGKTTLLSVIGGLNRPTEGKIYVCEKSLYDQKKSFLEEYRNEFVSFIFQDNNLIERMTVLENISLSYQLQNQKPDIDEESNIKFVFLNCQA